MVNTRGVMVEIYKSWALLIIFVVRQVALIVVSDRRV